MKNARLKRKKADTSGTETTRVRRPARRAPIGYLSRTRAADPDEDGQGRLCEAREPVPAFRRIVLRDPGLYLR